jgi:glycosyltransferase involved in cell wall biosynthesis
VTYLFPFPPDCGYKLRVYNTIKELSRSNEIDLLCFVTSDPNIEQKHIQSYCRNVRLLKKPVLSLEKKLFRYFCNAFGGAPYILYSAWDEEKILFTRDIIRNNAYDVIMAEHLIAGHIVHAAMAHGPKPARTVIVNHNVESDLYRSISLRRYSILTIPYFYAKFLSLREYEKKVVSLFDLAVVMSERDRKVFEGMCPGSKFLTLPNGVDTDFFVRRTTTPENHDVYYAGSFNYYPNVDAVCYFVRDIFPAVRAKVANARFFIAGNNPPEEVVRLHDGDKIIVLGYQNDVRTIMNKCAVSIAPLRLGGGTRLKIVEAMSMGIPVVSTSKGAEGIDAENGRDILVADESIEFAEKLIELLMSRDKLTELAANGRRLIEAKYSWKVLTDKLQSELRRLTG